MNRRDFVAAAAISLALSAGAAHAEDWRSKYKELSFAVVPAENASGVADRYAPFIAYLSKQLGVPVKLHISNDYAAVIVTVPHKAYAHMDDSAFSAITKSHALVADLKGTYLGKISSRKYWSL